MLAAFRGQYPGVALRVEVSNWQLLLERLQAEDIEFFVADASELPDDPALDIRSMGRQQGGFYVARRPSLGGPRVHAGPGLGLWCGRDSAAGRRPRPRWPGCWACRQVRRSCWRWSATISALLKSVALATDTVLASTDMAARDAVESGALQRLQVRNLPPLYSQMGVVSLRNRTLSPTAQRVIHGIETLAAQVNVQPA